MSAPTATPSPGGPSPSPSAAGAGSTGSAGPGSSTAAGAVGGVRGGPTAEPPAAPLPTPVGTSCELAKRRVWAGPAALAAGAVAIVAFVAWLVTSPKSQPEIILAVAVVIAIAVDGVTASRALRNLDVDVQNPIDAVA